ncbi:MAG: site-2 protease family protein [Planctomycetota bacterium]
MSIAPSPPSVPAGPPVKMTMRADLTFDRMTYQGVEYWVIKEPLGQKYYQFPPHVFSILRQLDGNKTIDEIQDNYHRDHAPKRITRSELQQLLMRFHRDGLVISDMPGQGSELLKRGRKNEAMERFGQMANILAVRYRGFDPERLLNWMYKYTWWLFTQTAVVITLIAASIALLSVIVNFGEFSARLPGFQAFFDPRQWYMFVGVLCVTKVCHEFGHGLACKRMGGECHEIGFMLLVLTPCLYCNVSDSWRLPNKWHRAAIGAAGMYIEAILATIATFIWWFVQPGIIQDICLQVMLISSVSTVLFNGNPLLRFDGYYITSDLLEIPNLMQKSNKALTTLLGRHWLGLEIPDDQLMPANRPLAFASYTVAAFFYRIFILFAIFTFLIRWLEPYGLESLGKGIASFALIGIVVMPGYKLFRYMSVPGRMHQVKKLRFFVVLGILVAAISLLLMIPVPHKLRSSLIIVPANFETVYVLQDGNVEDIRVEPGQVIEAGATIAVLRNIDIERTLVEARQNLELKIQERDQLVRLKSLSSAAPDDLQRLSSTEKEIEQLQKLIVHLEDRAKKLTLKSTIGGTVLEVPYQHTVEQSPDVPLLDPRPFLSRNNENVSAVFGQRFCEVADFNSWDAVILLTEDQLMFAKEGDKVRIKLYSNPDRIIESTIESIGVSDRSIHRDDYVIPADPNAVRATLPDLVAEMVAAHQQQDIQYYARVPIEVGGETGAALEELKIGIGGQARVIAQPRSLGARLMWWVNQTFRM